MKSIQLMYAYRGTLPADAPATHVFHSDNGTCGYEINRFPNLSAFWDDGQTLLIPTDSIVNLHIVN